MNRSKIPWCDHTFNPVTGCKHGCEYCYARDNIRRFSGDVRENLTHTDKYTVVDGMYVLDEPFVGPNGERIIYPFGFEPTYHRYRLKEIEKLKGGHNVFVGAMADLFGEWVPDWVISEVMESLSNNYNNYLFLTKNPARYRRIPLKTGPNFWYGTTITNNDDFNERTSDMIPSNFDMRIFVSLEPLHERLSDETLKFLSLYEWIIVGAETGNRKGKPEVQPFWISDIVHALDGKKPIFMKESLRDLVDDFREEYPPELAKYVGEKDIVSKAIKERRWDRCILCGDHKPKKEMVTLTARAGRATRSVTMGFMCRDCLREFCYMHNIPVPQVEGMNDG